jgi:nucleotide-binding universal stress UspA family protein
MIIRKILVPVDFSPRSDAALDHALMIADESGAEVEVLYVWRLRRSGDDDANAIFADTPEGIAMEQRLSAADRNHAARVCGRLEFGDEPARVALEILRREPFDLVVMPADDDGSEPDLARKAPCKVITTRPPPPQSEAKIVAA